MPGIQCEKERTGTVHPISLNKRRSRGFRSRPRQARGHASDGCLPLELDGEQRFPAYALNAQAERPLPAMAAILTILAGRDAWFLAVWFEALNSYLGGARPREVLAQDPVRVIMAARAEAEAVDHG